MGHIICSILETLCIILLGWPKSLWNFLWDGMEKSKRTFLANPILKKPSNICILKGSFSACFPACEIGLALAGLLWGWTATSCQLWQDCLWPGHGLSTRPAAFLCLPRTLGPVFSAPRPGNVLKGLLKVFIYRDCFIYPFTYYYCVLKMRVIL